MRRTWAALLLLLLIPTVPAQEPTAPLVEDQTGDVAIHNGDGSFVTFAPEGNMQNMDLTGFGILGEDPNQITFFVTVRDLVDQSETQTGFADPQYYVHFTYGEEAYRVIGVIPLQNVAATATGGTFGNPRAIVQQDDGNGNWRSVGSGEATADYTKETVTLQVERGLIVDQDHAPLDRGALLTGLYATSQALGFGDFDVNGQRQGFPYATDRAPDEGVAPDYEIQTGIDLQRGQLFSTSADPIRWTNGEATTFSYTVQVTNRGDEEVETRVSTEAVPNNWAAAHPDFVTVPAQSTVNATILMTIPFSHAHGTTQEFLAVFEDDDAFTKTRLGVHWPAIPQPAGHHDTVWFHSRASAPDFPLFDTAFQNTNAWFNAATAEVDTVDQQVPVRGFVSGPPFGGTSTATVAFWQMEMSPALRMGLDFDITKEGVMSLAIDGAAPVVDPYVDITLSLIERTGFGGGLRGGDGQTTSTVLARGSSAVQSGVQNPVLRFEVPLNMTPEADLIPYNSEANTNLRVTIALRGTMAPGTSFGPEGTEPRLLPAETTMTLPLFEYHDNVDQAIVTDRSLIIDTSGQAQERLVNPGRTIVYRFPVQYQGEFADTFELDLTGTNTAWATIIGDTRVRFQPDQTREVAFMVTAPEDSRDGDVADLTLSVRSANNAAVEGHIRTISTVTTAQDIPDESPLAQELSGELTEDKDSPGVGLLAVLALLVVLVRRRK